MQLFSRTAEQRGAIAPMAAAVVFALCVLAFAMLATAQFEVHREALRHGTDAVAIGNAMALEMLPLQQWSPQPLSASTIMSANLLGPGNTVQGGSGVLDNLAAASGHPAGWYVPALIAIGTDGVAGQNMSFGYNSPAVSGRTQVYFNQISATMLFPVKNRIMLMLDFSRSMRLPVETGGEKAHNVLQGAVADLQVLPLALRVNWGMRIFAGATTAAQAAGLTFDAIANDTLGIDPDSSGNLVTQAASAAKLATMNGIAQTEPTLGDSTDIATAVEDTIDALPPATNPNVGPSFIELVTDGEPDAYQGQDFNGMTYSQRIVAADAAALGAVQTAWSQGVESIAIYINRQQVSYNDEADKSFLQSISGTASDNPKLIDFAEADDADQLHNQILDFPVSPRCRTAADLTQMLTPSNKLPTPNDAVFGAMGGINGEAGEVVMTYCGQGDTVSINGGNDPTGINACMDPTTPSYDDNTGAITNLPAARYAFYYDAPRKVFELNKWACAVYLDTNGANVSGLVSFRARWGVPWLLCGQGTNGCNPLPTL